ncbi:MAG: DNA repair protein RadC [Micropepsaceae bacterium]
MASEADDAPAKASPHAGHRERLRARFLKAGADALADHELIELLLFSAIPRKDTKPLAKQIIATFGSFEEALAAPAERLRTMGLSDVSVGLIKVIEASAIRLAKKQVYKKPLISSWTALLDYCKANIARAPVEQFRVLLLDRKNRLIDDALMAEGTIDHTPVYPREIVKRALEVGASSIILVHNHPSGDPTPSRADIDMTKAIAAAAKPLGVTVHDHLVIGRAGHASFRELGLL